MYRKVINLTLFAIISFVVISFIPINWIARKKALALVKPSRTFPVDRNLSYLELNPEKIEIRTTDGINIIGDFLPSSNHAAVILLHGHASNRSQMEPEAEFLYEHGFGVLLYDARNSGESEGDLTTLGLNETLDVEAAYNYLASYTNIDKNRIGVLGHSMGGATSILAGAQIQEIAAVVAESSYTSLSDNIINGVENYLGLPAFPFAPLVLFWGQRESGLFIDQVNPIGEIHHISPSPVLIIHGKLDQVVPVENAYRLYEAAEYPKQIYIIENAGHGGFDLIDGWSYQEMILNFFRTNLLD